uniref:Uncharacterized protein n=1 Tax=Ananas comosus var. bracteatus TaxID=296719 RepID=A0A6V7PI54_ANACO|nr:unnamed protein product [Ananas comosus var. bracteatus]
MRVRVRRHAGTMLSEMESKEKERERERERERGERGASSGGGGGRIEGLLEMEDHSHSTGLSVSRVKATLQLGSESYSFDSESGILSQQLDAMKEKSMGILKEYITKHNVPNDVPDEPLEGSSEDDAEELNNPPKKSKKQK